MMHGTASSRLTLKETKQQRRVLPGITHWQMTPTPFIYMNDISMQQTLVTYFTVSGRYPGSKEQSAVVANTLTDFNKLIGYVSAGIIIILLGVAVFLISNTITVGISVRREEIGIMKLIGATDYFVRAPFVVERYCDQS